MRRTAIALVLFAAVSVTAQTKAAPTKAALKAAPAPAPGVTAPADRLPVRRVVLYKNGVGYFEHTGQVRGTQELSIDFTSGQLNDVVKSLTVLDLGQSGGKISSVRYNSTAPLAERLKGLRLPVGAETTLAGFLSALRGARVEVRSGAVAAVGRLLSVDEREIKKGEFTTTVTEASVVADSGEVRVFEVTPSTSVRILEHDLNMEVGKYMGLVASTRERDIRRMTISAEGSGDRQVFVSYISEVPIWKSTYRIILPTDPKAKPLLQGWAVVDNTVGEDWKDVQLSLVAGAPQSFIQQLSQTYYSRRPTVGMPQAFQLTPQTHEETMAEENAPSPVAPPPPPAEYGGSAGKRFDRLNLYSKLNRPSAGGAIGGVLGGNGVLNGMVMDRQGAVIRNARVTATNKATGASQTTVSDSQGRYNFYGLQPGNYSVAYESSGFNKTIANLNVSGRNLVSNNVQLNVGAATETVEVSAAAYAIDGASGSENSSLADAAAEIESEAEGQELGDLFEYKLKQHVTIGKNQSALVPIVHANIDADKVSLWNPSRPRALRALWINNTSGLSLDAGTFNILEDNTFAGEGVLDVIKPGEKRLLSYAVDQGIHIDSDSDTENERVTRVRIVHGIMTQTSGQRQKRTYKIRNADATARTVVIEHPARNGWKITSETKPVESTSSFHRFRVNAEPNKTAELVVDEFQPLVTNFALTNVTDDEVALFLRQKSISPELEKTLRAIIAQRAEMYGFEMQIQNRRRESNEISQDQQRLRENMKALKGTAEEKALTQRYASQLNQQEDRLAVVRKETADLETQRDKSREKLTLMIQDISLDVSM